MTTDFSLLEFNPTVKKDILKVYTKLRDIIGDVDDRMARYVILMYDISSPMRSMYPDLSKRKDFSASVAGYDLDKEKVIVDQLKSLTVDAVIDGEKTVAPHDVLLDAISAYLKYQNSRLWSMIITNEQSFYEYQRRIMAEIGGEVDKDALSAVTLKTKLLEAMDDIHRRLEKYYNELTGSDKNLEEVITKRRRISPESIAVR